MVNPSTGTPPNSLLADLTDQPVLLHGLQVELLVGEEAVAGAGVLRPALLAGAGQEGQQQGEEHADGHGHTRRITAMYFLLSITGECQKSTIWPVV